MKTIVVTSDYHSVQFWKTFFLNSNLGVVITDIAKFDEVLDSMIQDGEIYAVVIDKINIDINYVQKRLKNVDFFIILSSLMDSEKYQRLSVDCRYKFYTEPVGSGILLDDLKSITKIKDYMPFGEIHLGELTLNINLRTLNCSTKSVFLKNKEFDLLWYMAKHMGKVLTRATILDNVWDMNTNVVTNTVDVHISRIRKILKTEFGVSSLIKTIPCSGYLLSEVYGE